MIICKNYLALYDLEVSVGPIEIATVNGSIEDFFLNSYLHHLF